MRTEDYATTAPGTLVPLQDTFAFVPNQLPPVVAISHELLAASEAASGAIGRLVGQAHLIESIELVTSALARREAIYSSRMEGTETTVVELLLQSENRPPPEDSDLHEVLNYVATISLARAWLDEGREFGQPLLKDLHARLLLGARGQNKSPGALRRKDVHIGTNSGGFRGARFVPPPMEHVPALVDNLVDFMRHPTLTPLLSAAVTHYQFETIHPFEDGNGRLGRMLIPLQLMDYTVLDRPLLYLGPYLEAHSAEYRDGLLAVSQQGDWAGWILFILGALHDTALDALRRVRRILDLQSEYRTRVASHSNSRYALRALDVVFDRVFVSIPQFVTSLSMAFPTARDLMDSFVGLKILEPYDRSRGRQRWVAQELLDQIYAG